MEYLIDASPRTKRLIECLLPSMLAQLKLTNSRKYLHIKVDRELEEEGTTIPLNGLDTLLVVLKPNKDKMNFGVTLAHELTHVAQLAKGILKVTPKGKKWKGKFYGRSTPYLSQPWEIQAFARQEIIMRRALEE
jgi:hypothetical protein